jgi:uncharacterized protein (DUF433 family)
MIQRRYISTQSERCGGDPCIRDTRIPVWVVINYGRLGGTDDSLLRDYPSLTPDDLQAAREYAASHTEEIDRAIEENEGGEETSRSK